MGSSTAHFKTLPENATNYYPDEESGRIFVRDGAGAVLSVVKDDRPRTHSSEPIERIKEEGWAPILDLLDPLDDQAFYDWAARSHSKVWKYWITTPKSEIEGIRAFAATAEAGTVPPDWTERAATDGSTEYVLCTFSLTMDEARALGSAQTALKWGGGIPEGVHFFQRVSEIQGFSGVEKESRQPTTLDTTLYEPTDLFQTSHADAAEMRDSTFTEEDVLSLTGLTVT